MAITKTQEVITLNKTYTEKVEERTRSIRVEIPAGQAPKIVVTRETATYHDDVLVSTAISKRFEVTLSDLQAINKVSIMEEIANILDTIAPSK